MILYFTSSIDYPILVETVPLTLLPFCKMIQQFMVEFITLSILYLQSMNRSEISNDFNFENQLDISNTRGGKDMTQNFFSKEGFQFQDFMNIGDRTFKSDKFESKLHSNTSKFLKDQPDEHATSKILDEVSLYSAKRKNTRDQLLVSNTSSVLKPISEINSPKFIAGPSTKSIVMSPKKQEFTLRRADAREDSSPSRKSFSPKKNLPPQGGVIKTNLQQAFKKKDPSTIFQNQYKSIESQIRYYEEQAQKMLYETAKMEEENQTVMGSFNSTCHEQEIERHGHEIKELNTKIEEERQLGIQLERMVTQLQEEYDNVVTSIKTSKFPRPTLVRDEAKALIDEINALKVEFEALQRDDGSLNLSSTMMNPLSSALLKGPSSSLINTARQNDEKMKKNLQEIVEYNKVVQDPKYLTNIKMACLKTQWSLFSNSDIQVSLSYRDSPRITLRIGNKLTVDLEKVFLKHNGFSKLEGEVIGGKSYYTYRIDINPGIINQLFAKIQLSYQAQNEQRCITLFVPMGMTNFGEFSPITQKQFQSDAGQAPFQISSGFRPMDRKLLSSISEITLYLPNLIVSEQHQACYGLFIMPYEDCELVIIRQKGEMLSVSTRGESWPLVRMLEFIFTV